MVVIKQGTLLLLLELLLLRTIVSRCSNDQ
jgi:hypothetical protein